MNTMNLDTAAVNRLRSHLLEEETLQPDVVVSEQTLDAVMQRIEPFAEIMYLVMAADLDFAAAEKSILLNALSLLCDHAIPTTHLESLIDGIHQREPADEAIEQHIQLAAARIGSVREDREVAFLLAAVIAMADSHVEDVERQVVQWVREYLGISRSRMAQLLDDS